MSESPGRDDLMRAWQALAEHAPPTDACPPPERLWEAVRGELDPRATREVVAHTAECPACAEAWRLARELAPPGEAAHRRPRRRGGVAAIAAAAMVVLAVALGWQLMGPQAPPVERGGPPKVESRVPDGAFLPRDAFRLAWSPGPEGSRYDLLVTTPDLEVLAEAPRLEEPAYTVPADALGRVPAGGEVLWRVEMALPDGRHLASPAFRAHIE